MFSSITSQREEMGITETRRLLAQILLCLATLVLMLTPGCTSDSELPSLPKGVTLESQIPEGTSWASILLDASDLASLTTEPLPGASSVLFSSSAETQKVSLAHLAREVLGDLDHGFFLRIDETENFVEATLAEAICAGSITWIWSANPVGTAVLYVDDSKTPALMLPFSDLLAGTFLPVRHPYASITAYGHNLHFPIVHTNSFRLAIRVSERKELSELFYHVAWNSLDPNLQIHPFDLDSVDSSAPLLGALAAEFIEPSVETNESTRIVHRFALAPGASETIFETDRSGTIDLLELIAGSKVALFDLWIEARWDGMSQPAVFCPLSMLAGVSTRFEDTHSLPSTVSGGHVTIRWPMPFTSGTSLSCINRGEHSHNIEAVVFVSEPLEEKDESRLRFHANYAKQESLSLTVRNVITLGEIAGPGRIVGCSLRVDSQSPSWWGEGDEIIWLDRYDKAAWRGTGTEDYFGFAWCSDQVFHHPLRGQTRADGSRSDRRIASMHRYHTLDRLPFYRYAKFEMEAWGLADGFMDYETTLMWYAVPPPPWVIE